VVVDVEDEDVVYDVPEYVAVRAGELVAVAGSAVRGQRGLRPVPHVGAGLAVCVVVEGDGEGFGDVVVVVGFGAGADVVVVVEPGRGADVARTGSEPVRTGCGSCVGRDVTCGAAVETGTTGCVAGPGVGFTSAVGPSLTLT